MTYAPDPAAAHPATPARRDQPSPSSRSPRAGFLSRLSVGQKLLLSSLTLGLPLLGTGLALANGARQQQQLAVRAAETTQYYDQLLKVQRDLTALRAASNVRPSPAVLNELEQAANGLAAAPTLTPESRTVATAVGQQVMSVAEQLREHKLNPAQLDHLTTNILSGDLRDLFRRPARDGGLLTGGSYESQALATMISVRLPSDFLNLNTTTGDLSRLLTQERAAQGKTLSAEQRLQAQRLLLQGQSESGVLERDIEELFSNVPQAGVDLSPVLTAALNTSRQMLAAAEAQLNQPLTPQTVNTLRRADEAQVEAQYAALRAINDSMSQSFGQLQQQATRRLALLLGGLALLLALVLLVNRALLRSILRPLEQLTSASKQLASGNLAVKLPVTSNDEFGTLASSFNEAATQLRVSAERTEQERVEAQRLQNNIGQFLDVTMDIAEGDLTKRGVVTEDILGNVVDSINLMTDELAATLQQVQAASASVSGGSKQMLGTTEAIQQGAQLTAAEAQRVAEQVSQITATIRQMAQNAQTSAQTAREALLASQQGQEALQETLGGMQNIRREVQQVSKRIKTLGDRSLEIQEIVDTISQIARRTNLLALNASVEAAGAGDAGGRFGAVADEIRQLATTSAQATTRIAGLIKSVQAEVQDVIVEAEEGTREVEQGYRIAGSAGQRLQDIGELTERSAQLAESIAASTQEQVQSVERVNAAVQQIAEVAQRSESAVQQGRSTAQQLEDLARQLDTSLARFRLPEPGSA
ncbi:methyl-accepting chemotaxis protein [Deinococcus sp. PESE-13]